MSNILCLVKIRLFQKSCKKWQTFNSNYNKAGYTAQDAPSVPSKITRDGPTDGHDLLKRCDGASKNARNAFLREYGKWVGPGRQPAAEPQRHKSGPEHLRRCSGPRKMFARKMIGGRPVHRQKSMTNTSKMLILLASSEFCKNKFPCSYSVFLKVTESPLIFY